MSDSGALAVVLLVALAAGVSLAFAVQLIPQQHRHKAEWLVLSACLIAALAFDSQSEGPAHGVSLLLFLALPIVGVFTVSRFALRARGRPIHPE